MRWLISIKLKLHFYGISPSLVNCVLFRSFFCYVFPCFLSLISFLFLLSHSILFSALSLSLFLCFVIDSLHDGIGIPWQLLRGIATFSFIRQCLIAACIKLSVYFLCRYDIWFVTMLVSFSGCWWSTYNSSSFEHEVFTAPLW
jgi:hypothetical protein